MIILKTGAPKFSTLLKAHIKSYTKKDGTFVAAHEDSRPAAQEKGVSRTAPSVPTSGSDPMLEEIGDGEQFKAAKAYVIGHGKKRESESIEYGYAYNHGGGVMFQKEGGIRCVNLDWLEKYALSSCKNPVFVHNHPRNLSLSKPDLIFANSVGCTICAVSNDGENEYFASLPDNTDSHDLPFIIDNMADAMTAGLDALKYLGYMGNENPDELYRHGVNLLMNRLGVINYVCKGKVKDEEKLELIMDGLSEFYWPSIHRITAGKSELRTELIGWIKAHLPEKKELDMSHDARMERAKAMGFDTSKVWYHGTGKQIEGVSLYPYSFFTEHPDEANAHSKQLAFKNNAYAEKLKDKYHERELPESYDGVRVPNMGIIGDIPYSDYGKIYSVDDAVVIVHSENDIEVVTNFVVDDNSYDPYTSTIALKLGDNSAIEQLRADTDKFAESLITPDVSPTVYPVYLRYGKIIELSPFQVNKLGRCLNDNCEQDPETLKYVEELKEQGYDTIQTYSEDPGADGLVVQMIPLYQHNVRSINAAFDPAETDNPDMLKTHISGYVKPSSGVFVAPHEDSRPAARQEVKRTPLAPEDRFTSELKEAIISAPDKAFAGSASQVKAWLESNSAKFGGKDEIYWTGLNDYLDAAGKSRVSKQSIVEYLDAHAVRTEDIILGEKKIRGAPFEFDIGSYERASIYNDETEAMEKCFIKRCGFELNGEWHPTGYIAEFTDHTEKIVTYKVELMGGDSEYFTDENDAIQFIENKSWDIYESIESGNDTKYGNSDYKVAGGEDYKELIVTVPTVKPWNEEDSVHFGDVAGGKQICWIRFDTRKNEFGEKGLLLHELQSQRLQFGRTKGFITPKTEEERQKWKELEKLRDKAADDFFNYIDKRFTLDGELWRFHDDPTLGERDQFTALWMREGAWNKADKYFVEKAMQTEEFQKGLELYEKYKELAKTITPKLEGHIPPAPFITTATGKPSDAYLSLLLKKAISHAIDNDLQFVAWARGDQVADFYNLSKKIKKVKYSTKKKKFLAFDLSGHLVADKNIEPEQVQEYIGKTPAKKLLESTEIEEDYQVLAGTELEINAPWTHELYGDENGNNQDGKPCIIMNAADAIAKKLGGMTGSVKVSTGTAKESFPSTNPALFITPEMREKVLYEGMPMFSKSETAAKKIVVLLKSYVQPYVRKDGTMVAGYNTKKTKKPVTESGKPNSEAQIKAFNEAKEFVLKNGKAHQSENKEFSAAYDADGNIFLWKNGIECRVEYDHSDMLKIMSAKDPVVVHNHPIGGSLSTDDLKFAFNSGCTIYAIDHNGSEFRAKIINIDHIGEIEGSLTDHIMKWTSQFVWDGEITENDGQLFFRHIINTMLADLGRIDYSAKLTVKMPQILEKFLDDNRKNIAELKDKGQLEAMIKEMVEPKPVSPEQIKEFHRSIKKYMEKILPPEQMKKFIAYMEKNTDRIPAPEEVSEFLDATYGKMTKSHIRAYTKADGTFVAAHEDSRTPAKQKDHVEKGNVAEQCFMNAKNYCIENGKKYQDQQIEFGYAYTQKGDVLVKKMGVQGGIELTPAEFEELSKSEGAVFVHYHPSGQSLSGQDIIMSMRGNTDVCAVGRNGQEYHAHIKHKVNEDFLGYIIDSINDGIKERLWELINDVEITPQIAMFFHGHIRNVILDRMGFIEYRVENLDVPRSIKRLIDNIYVPDIPIEKFTDEPVKKSFVVLTKSYVKGHNRKVGGKIIFVKPYNTKVVKKPDEDPKPKDKLQSCFEDSKKYVLENGRALQKEEIEFASIYSPDGQIFLQKKGEKNQVNFTEEEMNTIRSRKGFTLIHNHPSSRSLSFQDMAMAFALEGNIVAIGNSGCEFSAQILTDYFESFRKVYYVIDEDVKDKFWNLINTNKITVGEADTHHHHLVNTLFGEQGYIKYSTKGVQEFPDVIKAVHEELKQKYFGGIPT